MLTLTDKGGRGGEGKADIGWQMEVSLLSLIEVYTLHELYTIQNHG